MFVVFAQRKTDLDVDGEKRGVETERKAVRVVCAWKLVEEVT